MARMKYLVLHCTATPEGREVTGADIRLWHTAPVANGGLAGSKWAIRT